MRRMSNRRFESLSLNDRNRAGMTLSRYALCDPLLLNISRISSWVEPSRRKRARKLV
jgi:hypothetical protein